MNSAATRNREITFLNAAKSGDLPTVKKALAQGINVNVRDGRDEPWDRTALMHAAEHSHASVVKTLLDASARVDLRDRATPVNGGGNTALHWAVEGGDTKIAKLLLKACADLNALSKGSNGTPLMLAVQKDNAPVAKVLLEAGADPTVADKALGGTPLHVAAQDGKTDLVRLLIRHGAHLNTKNNLGATPLARAIWQKNFDIADLLIRAGANVNAAEDDGTTCLMWAAISGYAEFIKKLLKQGANVNARDIDGNTALDIAIRDGEREAEAVLRTFRARTGDELSSRPRTSRK